MGKVFAFLNVLLVFFLVACSEESQSVEETAPVEAAKPIDTATLVLPTSSPKPITDTPEPPTLNAMQLAMTAALLTATPGPTHTPWPTPLTEFEVSWDGQECQISGPSVVPVGYHQVTWKNDSELSHSLAFRYLGDGHTLQDMLDLQGEPGRFFQRPSWVEDVEWRGREVEAAGEEIRTYHLDRTGNYVFNAWSPSSIWICGHVTAAEELSYSAKGLFE